MMHAPVFDQEIRERLERKPFEPFIIEFDDGRYVAVNKPKDLMAPSHGNTVHFGPDDELTFVDCVAVKRLSEAVSANTT